jgi:hypothetical protein
MESYSGPVNAKEFRAAFETTFAPAAHAAGLQRRGGRAPKWIDRAREGGTLTFGVRLSLKNVAFYPFEFMPDISWDGPRYNARDTGEVSYYQYILPAQAAEFLALQKHVVDEFVARARRETPERDSDNLAAMLSSHWQMSLRPHVDSWLQYFTADHAMEWGRLFGSDLGGWISRFRASPETREGWCWRVLWAEKTR